MNPSDSLTLFVGGTGYHPDDFAALGKILEGDSIVHDTPLYRGMLPKGENFRKKSLTERQQRIAELEGQEAQRLAEVLHKNAERMVRIIAQSRGNWLTILAMKKLQESHPETFAGNNIRTVLLAIAAADTASLPLPDKTFTAHNMDPEYHAYRGAMADIDYIAMMERQQSAFIGAMKILNPREHPVSIETANATLSAVPETVPLLTISGGADPYHHEANLSGIIGTRKNVCRRVLDTRGHWLHVECPQEVSAEINAWMQE